MSTILVVEDEPKLARLVVDYLNAAGHACAVVADGRDAIAAVRQHDPALVLLDLMLPGRDGIEICRELRTFSTIPVIMLTARVDELDRLMGLECGADDYLCKPFSPREVVARVAAQLRRVEWAAGSTRRPASPVLIDEASLRAVVQGVTLDLTPVEFRLLRLLVTRPGRVYSRDQVLNAVYADSRVVTDRTVDSHVRNLRRKFATVTGIDPIRSVYGVGYAFEWPEQAASLPP